MPENAYIVVTIPTAVLEQACPDLLVESIWKPAGISDLWVRVDPERAEMNGLRHAHVAHAKHINATNKQVAWNNDGSRHDRGRFDNGFKGIEKAKSAVRIALNLPDDVQLEAMKSFESLSDLLLEGYESDTSVGIPEAILEATKRQVQD